MTTALVYVETTDGEISGSSFELLHAARELVGADGTVEALLAAASAGDLAGQLGAAERIVTVEHAELGTYLPNAHRDVLIEAVRQRNPDAVLLSYSTIGLDLAAAVAFTTERPLVSYCCDLALEGREVRAVSQLFGGKLLADMTTALPAVFQLNPGAYREEAGRRDGTPEIESLAPPASLDSPGMSVKEVVAPDPGEVDLTQIERIVCVGRGIGDADSIDEARELADLLQAEIAGSRPVIDSGWLPKARQVGKSGIKVTPRLYLCLGVSGAPEHLEGMRDAELIIAVNSDAKAPIFDAAHYGATCDLFDLLIALKKRLERG